MLYVQYTDVTIIILQLTLNFTNSPETTLAVESYGF